MTKSFNFTMGCDPEFFLFDTSIDKFVSAHDLLPGTKKKPYKVKNGAIQVDGTAVEFNTDPASSPEEFASNVESVLSQLRAEIPKKYKFKFMPAVDYDKEYFETIPKSALELGCDPDFTAYSYVDAVPNPRPEPVSTMRTGSGHLHFGWTSGKSQDDPFHKMDCHAMILSAEAAFKAYMRAFDSGDNRRSKMYGKPAAFRYKPYGVEYRTPSNTWLNYPAVWPWIFQMGKYAFDKTSSGSHVYFLEEFRFTRSVPNVDQLSSCATSMKKEYRGADGYPLIPMISSKSSTKEW
jgi:hypothetical protein